MNDSLLKLEVENLRELLRLKDLNNDLFEINHAILKRLTKKLIQNNDYLDSEVLALLGRANQILREIHSDALSTDYLQGKNQSQNGQSLKTGSVKS